MSVIPGRPYSGAMKRPIGPGLNIGLLNLLLLVALGLSAVVWGASLVAGIGEHGLSWFVAMAGVFGVACASFVVRRVGEGFERIFEMPVFMTVLVFLYFGAAPVINFIDPATIDWKLHGDTSLLYEALRIVLTGMVAFWLGSAIARPSKKAPAVLDYASLPGSDPRTRTFFFGIGLYLVAFAAKVYMLRSGMYAYMQSLVVIESRLAEVQVLIVLEQFGLYALILFAIEAYYHPEDKVRRVLLWSVFAAECFWGLISGMKGMVLQNFLAVALVSSLRGRKLRMRYFAVGALVLVAIYPMIDQYRSIVRTRATDSVTSMGDATQFLRGAAERGALHERTAADWVASGWSLSVNRLNMLQPLALVLAYQDRAYLIETGESLWMIPLYPFIPRLLWPGKPVQDKGLRVSKLLGGGSMATSAAVTVPGDLYVFYYGIPGLLVGMFLIGLVAQWLTNPVTLCPSKRNVFIYGCMFFAVAVWGNDIFGYSTLTIRTFVIAHILAAIIYGPARAPSRVRKLVGRAVQRQ
jgi:uncharacterized membrane protein